MSFSEFGLHPDLLDGIDALNFTTATPIQEQAIPLILEGRDLIGVAQTGTGKTAAFILPILNEILESNESHYTQALVIVPTRELAMQIDQVIGAYSYFTGVSSLAIYGGGEGKAFAQEKTALTGGADILVATPGRLLAHMNLGYVNFKRLRFLVLDEADRMLDMGFMPDLQRIIDTLNPKRQSLLFSATMPNEVLRLAQKLLKDPAQVTIALSKPAAGVAQSAYFVSDHQKLALMSDLLRDKAGQRILVFGSTKLAVNKLYQKLRTNKNLNIAQISSDLDQSEREQVMQDFRNRKVDILVATDVLSRGIDIDGIDLVVNYDIPRDAEDYVHRIGRTARAERKGEAITLVSPLDLVRFKRIEKLIGREVEKRPLPAHLQNEGGGSEHRGPRRHGESGGSNRNHPSNGANTNGEPRKGPPRGKRRRPKNTNSGKPKE